MPNVPTAREAGAALGLKSFDISTGFGFFGPADMASDNAARLNKAFVDTLARPGVKARMAKLMAEPATTTSEQFGGFVRDNLLKYPSVMKASGAPVD